MFVFISASIERVSLQTQPGRSERWDARPQSTAAQEASLEAIEPSADVRAARGSWTYSYYCPRGNLMSSNGARTIRP